MNSICPSPSNQSITDSMIFVIQCSIICKSNVTNFLLLVLFCFFLFLTHHLYGLHHSLDQLILFGNFRITTCKIRIFLWFRLCKQIFDVGISPTSFRMSSILRLWYRLHMVHFPIYWLWWRLHGCSFRSWREQWLRDRYAFSRLAWMLHIVRDLLLLCT